MECSWNTKLIDGQGRVGKQGWRKKGKQKRNGDSNPDDDDAVCSKAKIELL